MKIDRKSGPPIIIGKRVAIGQIILGAANIGAMFWDLANPDTPIPAAYVGFAAQSITGIVQIYLVNKFGVTSA